MKKFKSFIALVLALVMALSFAACGKGSDDKPNKPAETAHPEFVYSAEFKSLALDADRSINLYGVRDEGIYVGWMEKTGTDIPEGATVEYEGQYDIYESRLGLMSLEGEIKPLANYRPIPRAENTEGKKEFSAYVGLNSVLPMADGKIMTIEYSGKSWSDAPEGMSRDNDEYWNYYQYVRENYIRVFEADGTEISSNLIIMDPDGYLNTYNAVVDGDGNLVTSNDYGVIAIAPDGSTAYSVEMPNDGWIDTLFTLGDGTIVVTTWGENGQEMLPLDLNTRQFGEKIELPRDAYNFYPGGGDYDLYYNSGVNFFGFDMSTGEATKILNWLDCDVNSNDMSNIAVCSDGTIVALLNHWSYSRWADRGTNSAELAIVKKVPYESVPQKTVLTMAAQYIGYSSLSNLIVDFNRSNDQYRISVKDYSEYNTEDDYSAGLTKLNTEILAGNLPDLILMNGEMPYEQYAAKGILADIYPYIDSDSELSREDFFSNVLSALEVDGKLYQAVSSFSLQCVAGAKSVVGDTPGWNYDQFNAALASMPEGCDAFEAYVTRDQILQTCLALDMGEYVNWSTGECRFDSPAFVQLLEFAKTFPEEFDYDNYDWETDNPRTRLAEGKQMLTSAYVYSFDDIIYNDTYFGAGNTTYIGFPTSNGVGNMLSVDSGIAITRDCVDKDGAWQFVRNFLTEKGQEKTNNYAFPSNKKLFDRYLEKEMTPEYEKDAEGNYILDENGERIQISRGGYGMPDGTVVEIYALTQEQADSLVELIYSTTKLANYNDSMFGIVTEQAQAFFAGQKSAEEVAKLIQSKANIYVNEQR